MEYTLCEYCGRPFLRKNKMQKYHKKCIKKVNQENKNYLNSIKSLYAKENKQKHKMEAKYITLLICIKEYPTYVSIDGSTKMGVKVRNSLRMKEVIEKEGIINGRKILYLNDLEVPDLKKRLEKLEGVMKSM